MMASYDGSSGPAGWVVVSAVAVVWLWMWADGGDDDDDDAPGSMYN